MAKLSGNIMKQALTELGAALATDHEVELHLVGGAAILLTKLLPEVWTTSDLDVIAPRPPGDVEELLAKADIVADKIQIERGWLNLDAGLFANTLPEGWESRRVEVGQYDRLRVYALSRADLIASKFYAHREKDIEHLSQMNVTPGELHFVQDYLGTLRDRLPDQLGTIEMALHIVRTWNDNN